MKVLLIGFMLVSCSFASKLISQGEIETLFKKFIHHEVSGSDQETLNDLIELFRQPHPLDPRQGRAETSSLARNALDCILCQSAFAALFDGVRVGQTDEELTDALTILCTSLGIQSYAVCRGAVALNMPILTHIVRTTPEATPGAFCSLLLQNAGAPPTSCPLVDPRFEWQVDLPPPADSVLDPPNSSAAPLKIVVLTDAHIDPLYEAFGVADCDAPTCCRKGQTPRTSYSYQSNFNEALLSNSVLKRNGDTFVDLETMEHIRAAKFMSPPRYSPLRDSAPAGYWGDYRNCDTPIWAFDNVIDEIAANHQDVDLIYYIGDSIDHFVWETSYELIQDVNAHVVNKIRASFGDVPVIPAIGNHESQPTNQFAPSSVTGAKINTTWLYESLSDKWGGYLSDSALASLRARGDFSLLVRPGLRVISINNNVAYRNNWWLVYDPQDSKRHLEWLIQELAAAELAGEKVHILAHIPPGVHDLIYTWTREYNRIVNRFSSTIAAELNGHTHSDEFKVFYDEDGAPTVVAWGAGSATTYSNYNLNYKIVTADGDNFEITGIQNYVYNLTEANLTPNRNPHWFQLYDMAQRFNLPDLSASSLDDLVHRMVTGEKQMLDLYSAFYSKLSDTRWPFCNDECKINDLCKTVVTVLWERQKCEELRDLFYSTNS